MEVLRPQLIRIGGRIYRKNPIQEQTYQHEEEDEDFYQGNPSCSLVRLEVKCSLYCRSSSLFCFSVLLCCTEIWDDWLLIALFVLVCKGTDVFECNEESQWQFKI